MEDTTMSLDIEETQRIYGMALTGRISGRTLRFTVGSQGKGAYGTVAITLSEDDARRIAFELQAFAPIA